MAENNDGLTLGVSERPSAGLWALLSLQHLFAMFGATVLVPLLVGLPPEVALVTSGVGTLIYIFCTGAQVPAYLGSSFAFIGPILAGAAAAGMEGALLGAFGAGCIYLVVAALVRAFGVGWLLRLLPPVVVGPVIIVIGLSLASVAVQMAEGTVAGGDYDLVQLLVALATLGAIIFFSLVLKGFFTVVPILLGILVGYLIAAVAGLVDFAPLAEASLFRIPDFVSFLGVFSSEGGVPWGALTIIAPVAIVTMAEHIGDTVVLSRVVGRNFVAKPGLHRTLLGDGLATMVAALIGGPPNTTYGENVGVLAITRIYSIYVIAGAAVMAILLGFVGIVAAFLSTIPTAVMGGVSIALFGVIASSGIRTLIEGKVDFGERRNLLVASVILVIGIGGATLQVSEQFTVSSMALAAIVGVFLHAVLPDRHLGGDSETVLGSHG